MTPDPCTQHPTVDWLLQPLTPALIARIRAEIAALDGECGNGHPNTPENSRYQERRPGIRFCVPCARAQSAAYQRRRRAS
jgi:hypothetical protein